MFSVLVFLDYLTYRDFQNRISVGTFQWFSITWRWTTFIQKKFNRKVQLIPKNAQWHAQGYRLFKSPTSHEYTSRCSLFSELPVVSLFQESEVSFSTPDISRIRVSSIPRIRSDFYLLFLLFDLQKHGSYRALWFIKLHIWHNLRSCQCYYCAFSFSSEALNSKNCRSLLGGVASQPMDLKSQKKV